MMPSRNPGQFSTIVVSISCPPASRPSTSVGFRLARARVQRRGQTRRPRADDDDATVRTSARCLSIVADDGFLRLQPDDRLGQLPVLEQQQRRDAADRDTGSARRGCRRRSSSPPWRALRNRTPARRPSAPGGGRVRTRAPRSPRAPAPVLVSSVEVTVGDRLHFVGCHLWSPPVAYARAAFPAGPPRSCCSSCARS